MKEHPDKYVAVVERHTQFGATSI